LADSAEKLRRELGQVQSRISFVRRRRRSMRHSRSSKHRLFNESLPQRLAQVQTDSFSLAASADSSSNDSSQAGSDGSAKSANERSSANVAADESDLFMPKVAGAVANDVASPVNADQVGASNDSDSGQVEAMADMGSAAPQQLNSAPPQVPQDQGSDASSIPTVGFGSVSSGAVSQASSPTGVVVGRSSIDHGAFRLERRSPALKSMSETDLKKEKKRLEEMLKSIQQKQSSLR